MWSRWPHIKIHRVVEQCRLTLLRVGEGRLYTSDSGSPLSRWGENPIVEKLILSEYLWDLMSNSKGDRTQWAELSNETQPHQWLTAS